MKTIVGVACTIVVLILVSAAPAPAGTVLWLETEKFTDLGGWTNDAQFIAQMGSPYLLAVGLDGPVKDAATQVTIPAAGRYRLWVRTRDWVPEHSPGRFQVVLGERPVEHVFGQSKAPGWRWEDGGTHELAAGPVALKLHDLTGHYGRCDVIVLTDDPAFQPPTELKALSEARQRHGGMSRTARRTEEFDTVVIGGGLAGTMAAVASARMGARTALVQNRPVLGGNGSEEVLVNPEGDTTREPLDPGEGGIIEEFRGDVRGYSQRMLKVVQGEKNLALYLNTHATGVEMEGKRIAAIEALSVQTGERLVIPGRVFIDCTGDGEIGVWAGNEYRHGREPAAMYQETRAPEEADGRTMGGTLRYATERRFAPVEFQAPVWARHFDECSDFNPSRHPQLEMGGWQWVIEYGGMLDTYRDAEEIRDELLRIIWGMWDHAKNHCDKLRADAKDYKLVWVSHVTGKRESRRLIGDYVMTEHDIGNQTLFPDRVSYGGWGIDIHPPGGFYSPEPPAIFSHKVKFSVPIRSLTAKDVDNLMMAGRDISVSHAALGATRVMITCGVQGQAVGTAAGFCKKYEIGPKELGQKYVADVQQQLLKDGCYLIDLPNRDPRDLARTAKVSATSVAAPETFSLGAAKDVHPLNSDRAVMFRTEANRIDKVRVHLQSENRTPTEIKAILRRAGQLGDFSSSEDLAAATARVPERGKGWVELAFETSVEPGYYWVVLPKTDGLSWSLFPAKPAQTSRAYKSGSGWTQMPDCYMVEVKPAAAMGPAAPAGQNRDETFAAANVTNGFARAVRGWPNSWRPDPAQPLPQSVELDFSRAVSFNRVHVSFQSQAMRADRFHIEAAEGADWRTVADVSENNDRRRVLRFDRVTAEKLRLTIEESRPDMGVCEIRVYDEP